MSRGSVFDYDAIGKRLKEISPEPYLKPAEPYVPKPPAPTCDCCGQPFSECQCWYGCD